MMKFLAILSLTFLSQFASAKTFSQWLEDTSPWCFTDTSGMWDHGRIVFKHNPWDYGDAKYNVTDAPGEGIDLRWVGRRNLITGRSVTLWRNENTWFRANVDITDEGMTWYWNGTTKGKSYLRRCN